MPPCCSSLLFRSRVALLLRATATSAFFFSLPPRARNCRLNGYARPGVCAQVTTPVVVVRKGVRGRLHAAVVGIMQRVFHGRRVERRCSSVLRAARGCYGLIFPLCSDRPLVPRLLVSSLPVLFSFPSLPKIPSDTWIYIYIYIYTHTRFRFVATLLCQLFRVQRNEYSSVNPRRNISTFTGSTISVVVSMFVRLCRIFELRRERS